MHPAARLLVYLTFLTAGCQALSPPVKVDLSKPETAAMEYLLAVQRADARTAHAASFGTPEQQKWVDGRIVMIDGMRKFDDALYARFGRVTSQVHTDMHDSLFKLADVWVLAMKDSIAITNENQARIDPKKNLGFFARSVTSIYLQRQKEGWKVDLAQTYASGTPPDQYAALDDYYHQSQEYGQVFRDVAREISAGKFRSADAASDALAERIATKYRSESQSEQAGARQ